MCGRDLTRVCPSSKAEPLGLTPLELGRNSWLNNLTHARRAPNPQPCQAQAAPFWLRLRLRLRLRQAVREETRGEERRAQPALHQHRLSTACRACGMQCAGSRVELQLLLDGEGTSGEAGGLLRVLRGGMWAGCSRVLPAPLMNGCSVDQSSQWGTLLPGDIWLCLRTFLVVTARGGAAGT